MENKKIIIGLLVINLLFNLMTGSYAQTPRENSMKYWYYRDRLKYFVMPGTDPGQSIVCDIRNRDGGSIEEDVYHYSSMSFGQEWTYMGMYIGVLATEYKLLKDNGQYFDAATTLGELNLALQALIRMDACEDGPPWFKPYKVVDGFFVRDDAPPVINSEMEKYFNKGLSIPVSINDFSTSGYLGKPAWIDSTKIECIHQYEDPRGYFYWHRHNNQVSITDYNRKGSEYMSYFKDQKFTSQDEVLGVLIGLTLTAKLVDNEQTYVMSREIAGRLISFFAQSPNCSHPRKWMPCFPDGYRLGNINGGDARSFAFKFKKIIAKIKSWQSYSCPNCTFYENIIDNAPDYRGVYWLGLNAATTVASADRSLRNLYIRLLSMADVSVLEFTKMGNLSRNEGWRIMFDLLWAVLHNKDLSNKNYNYDLLKINLNKAPCGGTYNYANGFYPDYWSAPNKWSSDYIGQHGNPDEKWRYGNFNGLDYMLLYNLAYLAFPNGFDYNGQSYYFPYYVNQINYKVSTYYPLYFSFSSLTREIGSENNPEEIRSINTIISDMQVSNKALFNGTQYIEGYNGDVTLIAGESIRLTDGFRVDSGAHFLAKIESYSCNGLPYKNMEAPPWSEKYKICFYDSLISIPMNERPPIIYNEDEEFNSFTDDYFQEKTSPIDMYLSPNPCYNNTVLHLIPHEATYIEVILSSISGQEGTILYKGNIDVPEFNLEINMSHYSQGVYLLKIIGNDFVETLKLIRE